MNPISFLTWHFSLLPLSILKITRNYLVFAENFFSIGFLLKTLFAPFKRQSFTHGPGFSLSSFLETVISNLISRFLGAIIRLFLITAGIITQILFLIIGLFLIILLVLLPFFTLPFYFHLKTKQAEKEFRHRLSDNLSKNPEFGLSASELRSLAKTDIGDFIFKRLLIPKENIGKKDLSLLLKEYQITKEDFTEVIRWYNHSKDEEEEYGRFWDLSNLLKIRPIGRDLAFGYTINLDRFTTDFLFEGYSLPHLVGRRKEIERIERILIRDGQNNVLLVGDPGSGRHAIILAFALDVFEGKVPQELQNHRVLDLNLNLLISEAKIETAIKGQVLEILKEAAAAGNIILVIDDFERFVGNHSDTARIDLTDVFAQVFTKKPLQVLAITNREAYHQTILPNSTLNKIFETVEISEISLSDTLKVLEHLVPVIEKEKRIFIPFLALTHTLKTTQSIINIPFPEKAIDILKEASILSASSSKKILTNELIDKVVSEKTKTPLGVISKEEKERLINLENLLHEYIVNQEQAISALSQSLRRARLEIAQKGRPIGSFLFLGPTGVGKTETAKTLARVYFGAEKQMIRFDMSQFQGNQALPSLLGNPENEKPGLLTKAVRENPFSVVLLDEIEKADRQVLNLLLTVLDEGYVNDSFGRRVSFENTIVIGTSNAGSEFIRQSLEENSNSDLTKKLTEFVLREKIFTPEFINRFDAVVVYKPLSHEHLNKIARMMLNNLNKRLVEKQISVNITDQLVEQIAKAGFDPQFGARPMKRVIQEKVEDYLAQRLLDGSIKAGEKIDILI